MRIYKEKKGFKFYCSFQLVLFILYNFFSISAYAKDVEIKKINQFQIQKTISDTKNYVFDHDETISSLSRRYNLSISALKHLNPSLKSYKTSDLIKKGTLLILPSMQYNFPEEKTYKAAKNDWLPLIAKTNFQDLHSSIAHTLAAKVSDSANQKISSWLEQYGTVRLQLDMDNSFKPNADIALLLPLFDRDNFLLFAESHYLYNQDIQRANFGAGIRYFLENSMVGLNGFFDYELGQKQARTGVGLEYWRNYLNVSLNGYLGMSDWSYSKIEDYLEKPASGFDVKINSYLPFHPQLGLSAGFEQYLGENIAAIRDEFLNLNPQVYNLGLSYTPFPFAKFNVEYKYLTPKNTQMNVALDLTYRLGVPFAEQFSFDAVDKIRRLQGSRYEFVNRNHNIILAYKKTKIKIKENIEGKSEELVSLNADISLDPKTLIQWDLLDKFKENGGTLSPECYDVKKFSSCKIKIPFYKGGGNNNIYNLSLSFIDSKQSAPKNLIKSFNIRVTALGDEISLRNPINAESNENIFLFQSVSSSPRLSLKKWDFVDILEENGGKLSPECFDFATISECKLTAPLYNEFGKNEYKLALHIKVKNPTKGDDEIVTRSVIQILKPKEEKFKVYEPISGYENQKFLVFEDLDLRDGWNLDPWVGIDNLPGKESALSEDCFSLENLKKCEITLPQKSKAPEDDFYTLGVSLKRLKTNEKKYEDIHIYVKKAPQEKIQVNEKIIGYQSEKYKLFDDIYLSSKDWKISYKWPHSEFEKLGGKFSPECNVIDKLQNCRITLPKYSSKLSDVQKPFKNIYAFDVYFENQKTYEKRSFKDLLFTVYPDISIIMNSPISAKEKTIHDAFENVALDKNWEYKSWEIAPEFLERNGKLSSACYDVDDLKNCKITLPEQSDSKENDEYSLKFNLRNKINFSEKSFTTRISVLNSKYFILDLNSPLVGDPEIRYPVVKRYDIPQNLWRFDGWDIPEDFTKDGGFLSDQCFNLNSLKECMVKLPKKIQNIQEKKYNLSLKFYNLDLNFVKTQLFEVLVKGKEASKDLSSLSLDKDIAPVYSTINVELNLRDLNNEAINIRQENLEKILKLHLKNGENLAINPLHAEGNGRYTSKIIVKDDAGIYNLVVDYYDQKLLEKSFEIYSDKISKKKSDFNASDINPVKGDTIMLEFIARNDQNRLLERAKDQIKILVQNEENIPYTLSDIVEDPENPAHYFAYFSAEETGEFLLIPSVRITNRETEYTPFNDHTLTINVRKTPLDINLSTLEIDNQILESVDETEKLDRTFIHFLAKDKNGEPLSKYKDQIQFIIRDSEQNKIDVLSVVEVAAGQYTAIFKTSKDDKLLFPGEYTVSVCFADEEIEKFKKKITIKEQAVSENFSTLKLDPKEVPIYSTINVELNLKDLNNKPIVIEQKNVNKVLKLNFLKKISLKENQKRNLVISPLVAEGDGRYTSQIQIKNDAGTYDLVVDYYNRAFIKDSFQVYSDAINEEKSEFSISNLSPEKDEINKIEFIARNNQGRLLEKAANQIKVFVQNDENIAYDLSDMVEDENNKGHYYASFSGKAAGSFTLTPSIRLTEKETEYTLFKTHALNVNVIDSSLDLDVNSSSLKIDNPSLVTADKNEKLDRTLIHFFAKNKDAQPLENLAEKIHFSVKDKNQKTVEELSVQEKTSGEYVALFQASQHEYVEFPGDYIIQVNFEGKDLEGLTGKITIEQADIDATKIEFKLDPKKTLLEDLKGLPLNLSFKLYNEVGDLQNPGDDKFQILLQDSNQQDVTSIVSRIEKISNNEPEKKYKIFAKQKGVYDLVVKYRKLNGEVIDLLKKKVVFLNDQPSSQSDLTLENSTLAVNDSAGYATQTKVTFFAVDDQGLPLDLSLYSDDKTLAIDHLEVIAKYQGKELQKRYPLQHQKSNEYTAIIDTAWLKDKQEIGNYHLFVYHNQKNLELNTRTIFYSPNYSLPQNVTQIVNPQKIEIGQKAEVTFRYQTKENYPQNQINDRLIYNIYKNGSLVLDGEEKYIQREGNSGDSYKIRFFVNDESDVGQYRIEPAYKLFDDNRTYKKCADGVTVQVVLDLSEEMFDPEKSEFKIDGEDKIATIDENFLTDRTKIILKAKDANGNLSDNLLNHGLYFSVKNVNGQEVEKLQPQKSAEMGVYEAFFESSSKKSYKNPGIYKIFVYFQKEKNLSVSVTVDPNLAQTDSAMTEFSLNREKAVLEKFQGLPIQAEILPKDALGNIQDYKQQNLSLKIFDERQENTNAAVIVPGESLNKKLYQIKAQQAGKYDLVLYALKKDGSNTFFEIGRKKLNFFDLSLDQDSKLSFKEPVISAEKYSSGENTENLPPIETIALFEPKIQGQPFGDFINLVKPGAFQFSLGYHLGDLNYTKKVPFSLSPDKKFKALINGPDIVSEKVNGKYYAGDFTFYLTSEFISDISSNFIQSQLTISPDFVFPKVQMANKKPKNGIIHLPEKGEILYTMETPLYQIPQKNIDIKQFSFAIIKNGSILLGPEQVKNLIGKISLDQNIVHVEFLPSDSGYYEINAYYKDKIVAHLVSFSVE